MQSVRDQKYKGYLLTVLSIILAFNYVDRLALGLLLQDIKADLALTDTELGVLSGIAFALFYSLMGIPIARWADRGNRVTIVASTTFLWSVAVALCGLAGGFWQLLLIRVGVAVGEAGCIPPAHSLIGDHFSRKERPRAVARYMLGVPMSMIVGYFVAGWFNELYGWRVTFMLLGMPGVALALLAWWTLREPRLLASNTPVASRTVLAEPADQPTLREIIQVLWRNAAFRHLLFAFSISSFFSYGILQWKPAFFIRSFGLQTGEVGTWFAIIYGCGGVLGTYLGGEWASRYAAKNECKQLRAIAITYIVFAVLSCCTYLSAEPAMALALLALSTIGIAMTYGPLFGTIQTLVPRRMRAMAIALVYLMANLIGMGLGPLVAGAMSDALRPSFGEESLRYALLLLSPGYLWGALHLWKGSATVMHDLDAVQNGDQVAIRAVVPLGSPEPSVTHSV